MNWPTDWPTLLTSLIQSSHFPIEEDGEEGEEEVQLMFVAPRPELSSKLSRNLASSQDKADLHWNGTNVRILPVESSFKNGSDFKRQNSFGRKNSLKRTKNSERMHFRSLSIPDVLLDIQNCPGNLGIFERVKPVYSPNCHPIDLEGLQETAV